MMTRRLVVAGSLFAAGLIGTALFLGQQSQASSLQETAPASVSLATDKPAYAPGEHIVITLRNHGRKPVTLSRDPAFEIAQRDRLIYAPVAALSSQQTPARILNRDEDAIWQWDQFALSGQVPKGDYSIVASYQVGGQTQHITTTIKVKD